MQIKLICSDIDGTLLNKDRELSVATISQVKRLSHIPFILISSRMPKAMTHLQREFGNIELPLIAYNGGLIIDNGNVIDTTEISVDIIEALSAFLKATSLHLSLYHNDEWYVPTLDYWAKREANNTKVTPQIQSVNRTLKVWKDEQKGAHKIMVMGDPDELDTLVQFIVNNYDDALICYRSKDTYLEIADKSISKKTAIEVLLKAYYPQIEIRNVLAFGDNYNDIEMLKNVGTGVAVKNANEAVLAIADVISDSNKEDGVAKYLELNL